MTTTTTSNVKVSSKSNAETPRERLAKRTAPIYAALAEVLSTEHGKHLAALAYDAGNNYKYAQDQAHKSNRKHATRQHEHDTNSAYYWLAKRHAYVDALSFAVCEQMNFTTSERSCRAIINNELAALEDRTLDEQTAAPIKNLFSNKIR